MPFQTIHIYCVSVQKFYTSKIDVIFKFQLHHLTILDTALVFFVEVFILFFAQYCRKNTITTNYEGLWA